MHSQGRLPHLSQTPGSHSQGRWLHTTQGFGGFFSVKYPEISAKMGGDKIADAKKHGADTIVGGDLGCLMHLAGLLVRKGETIKVRHAAEVLSQLLRG